MLLAIGAVLVVLEFIVHRHGEIALEDLPLFPVLLTKDLIPIVYHDFRLNPALTKDAQGNWIENNDIKIFDLPYEKFSKFKIGGSNSLCKVKS